MVFGTFDILHPGHLHFFKQARALANNPFLIVSIARDINVKKIKGVRPLLSEEQRLKGIHNTGLVNKVVLGNIQGYMSHILKEKPDVIALGYDQQAYTENLKTELRKRGLMVKIVRLKSHKPNRYKSSLLNENRNRSRAGKQ